MPATFAHAVLRHSAADYKGDPTFAHGLETRSVSKAEATKVAHAGGVLFPDYTSAEGYAMAEQYPEGYAGLIPAAPGSFTGPKIDGLAIYVPVTRPEGAMS